MLDEMRIAAEAAATLSTGIRPPSHVDLAVLAEVGAVAEGLATLTAMEGLLVRVDALMAHQ